MSQHPFDYLTLGEGRGRLILTPCPGTKESSLEASLTQLRDAGAAAVLTLMPGEELENNRVTAMPALCEELELAWFHLPVEDDAAPEAAFEQAWAGARDQVLALLAQGRDVAIHCKGGSGRTGLMAAIILLALEAPLTEAVQRVQALRPRALGLAPHRDYLTSLALEDR
ncbi:phosphatase domain-containing putative toxin [Zobellella iuensis]|uniref:Tyrosine-protein phosphatase n=1 Tax=Zobellella iuensis TaxID=2803811 RepID=A0ABS1QTI0_9GAMM|nr:tyrosine-protein phosphatase [Zobellella iuensis]MBL1378178.1 tyrosine-protein phosphatase [Zobellella iuensis]